MNIIYTFPPLPLPRPIAPAADPRRPRGPGSHLGVPAGTFLIFWLFETRLKFCFAKTFKKLGKCWILTSQNRSQTPSKSNQNRRPQKHRNFHWFLIDFCPSLQKPNLDFCAHGHSFVRFLHNSRVCFWHAFWKAKPCQKPFQNEVWTLQKSMPETCLFSTSIFRKFGLDLGGPWVSKMEPSWPSWRKKTMLLPHLDALKIDVL